MADLADEKRFRELNLFIMRHSEGIWEWDHGGPRGYGTDILYDCEVDGGLWKKDLLTVIGLVKISVVIKNLATFSYARFRRDLMNW